MEQKLLPYMVGGLLYTPAINVGIADKIEDNVYPCLMSMAFCLEDSIMDEALAKTEIELKKTILTIRAKKLNSNKPPLLFVRIRNPKHMLHIHTLLGESVDVITGYILPKFDLSNADEYIELIKEINRSRKTPLYVMPILESKKIADVRDRVTVLMEMKVKLDKIYSYVLNVRVGGSDFSNLYGLRRNETQTIYDQGVVRDILIDIINIFGVDYVVSGPVWEYFGEDELGSWALGLKRELELDNINGFIGKTAIHPNQLPLIYESLKVNRSDYEDALSILNWKQTDYGVAKGVEGTRMNEVKCHIKWANKISMLGQIYGVK